MRHLLRRLFASLVIALWGLALAGCMGLQAQNPSGGWSPVNAQQMDGDERVLLQGTDVVAYFTDGRQQAGSPAHRSVHQGVTLYFASAEHQAAFERSPQSYLPQFGGFCANALVYAIPMGGDPRTWKLIGGKLYIFGGKGSQEAFELDEKRNLALAHRYWQDEVRGSNSFVQRTWRLVLRVPHYKTAKELAAEVAAAKGHRS